MADKILHKRSSTPSAVPSAASLELGELALNTADGRAFMKKSNGSVVEIGSNGSAFFSLVTVTATSVGQTSFTIPGGYTPGAIVVFLNGSSLAPAHYAATNGTTVVLGSGTGVVVGSELVVLRLTAFQVADALPLLGTAADASKLGGELPEYFLNMANRTGFAGALAYRSTNLDVPNNTLTDLLFDTSLFDSGGCISLGADQLNITVPVSGLYALYMAADFSTATSNPGICNIRITDTANNVVALAAAPNVASSATQMSSFGLAYLNAGAKLKFQLFQNSGALKQARPFAYANRFGFARVG